MSSGLGQESMGFTGDQEDVNSMSLTVVHNLLEKHKVEMTDIGWMGVGTETILGNHKVVMMLGFIAPWLRTTKNREVHAGPLARLFARSTLLASLARSVAFIHSPTPELVCKRMIRC